MNKIEKTLTYWI